MARMESKSSTRERLVEVTRGMIDDGGVGAVSMRDLGVAMGLSRTAVYRHFSSKEDLFAAIATEDFERLAGKLAALQEEHDEARQAARAVLHAFYDFAVHHNERFRLMFGTAWEQDRQALQSAARRLFSVVYHCMEQMACSSNSRRAARELTAMSAAFVTGLVELGRAGHLEAEKGFGDPPALLDAFLEVISA